MLYKLSSFLMLSFFVSTLFDTWSNRAFAEQKFRLITEDYPPLNYVEQGELKGVSIEIVRAIQDKIKESADIEVMPWKRAFLTVSETPGTAIFSIARSPQRETLFNMGWSDCH